MSRSDSNDHSQVNVQAQTSTAHPLSVLTPEVLSRDDKVYPPENRDNTLVVFQDDVYVKDVGKERLLKYSLTKRSWDINIRLPRGITENIHITTVSKGLVLIGRLVQKSPESTMLNKMWIREGTTWKDDVIPSSPEVCCELSNVVAAAGCDNLLFVMYHAALSFPRDVTIMCYDFGTNQWKGPIRVPLPNKDWLRVTLVANDSDLYVKVYTKRGGAHVLMGSYSSTTDTQSLVPIKWENLKSQVLSRHTFRMTITENRLCVVDLGDNGCLKLYSPFTDASGDVCVVEVDSSDEYKFKSPLSGVAGLPDGALLVMGKVSGAGRSVLTFNSKAMNYDPNSQFTLIAIKRLERVANIPVLSDPHLEDKLSSIKTFAGFEIQCCDSDEASTLILEYMSSWLETYINEGCVVEPTWSKFLQALRHVGLADLAERIERCLKSAPEVEQIVEKEASGIEMLQAVTAKLEVLDNQLKLAEAVDREQLKQKVSKAYQECCAAANKIKSEMKDLKEETQAAPPPPMSDRSLSDEDHCEISAQIGKHAAKWREIGAHLGFLQGDMDTIQASPSLTIQGPKGCLDEMLAQWLQSAPGDLRGSKDIAKLSTLKSALIAAGFARTAYDLTLST